MSTPRDSFMSFRQNWMTWRALTATSTSSSVDQKVKSVSAICSSVMDMTTVITLMMKTNMSAVLCR